jgi:hypothetical protein
LHGYCEIGKNNPIINIDDINDEEDLPLMYGCITVDTKRDAKKLVKILTKAGYDSCMTENEDGSWTVCYDSEE